MVYHWDPNEMYGVSLESLSNLWCTIGILMKFMVYDWNPNEIYGVPLKSKCNLWCTTGIPIKCMACHWNPNCPNPRRPGRSTIQIRPGTSAGPENHQSKSGPGPPPAHKNHQLESASVGCWLLSSPHGKAGSAGK